jgi:hypothetical protein
VSEIGEYQVEARVFHAGQVVATHRRSTKPYSRVDPSHYQGLWRPLGDAAEPASPTVRSGLQEMGRSLDDYAEVVSGGGR